MYWSCTGDMKWRHVVTTWTSKCLQCEVSFMMVFVSLAHSSSTFITMSLFIRPWQAQVTSFGLQTLFLLQSALSYKFPQQRTSQLFSSIHRETISVIFMVTISSPVTQTVTFWYFLIIIFISRDSSHDTLLYLYPFVISRALLLFELVISPFSYLEFSI